MRVETDREQDQKSENRHVNDPESVELRVETGRQQEQKRKNGHVKRSRV